MPFCARDHFARHYSKTISIWEMDIARVGVVDTILLGLCGYDYFSVCVLKHLEKEWIYTMILSLELSTIYKSW